MSLCSGNSRIIITYSLLAPALHFLQVVTATGRPASTGIAFSIAELESLFLVDQRLCITLRKLRDEVQEPRGERSPEQQVVEDYVTDYQDGYSSMAALSPEESKEVIGNPIAVYRLVSRIVKMSPVVLHLKDSIDLTFMEKTRVPRPNAQDLREVADKVLLLHYIYDLVLLEFVQGKIQSQETRFKLRGVHCYEIGMRAVEKSDWAYAIEWLTAARSMLRDKELLEDTEKALKKCVGLHNKRQLRSHPVNPKFFTENVTSLSKLPLKRRSDITNITRNPREAHDLMKYWATCSGHNIQPIAEKSKLRCWLEWRRHPQFVIAPLKMEKLASGPDILQIHDFIGADLMEHLKDQARSEMERSAISVEGLPPDPLLSTLRTSVQAGLKAGDDVKLRGLTLKIGAAIGMETVKRFSAEDIQIGAYTSGAHFDCHSDSLRSSHGSRHGNRIATFMIYLSDVARGGLTAFPRRLVTARPVKGSALFWYNIFRDGSQDNSMAHCGCPVLLGEKWSKHFIADL